MTVAELGERLSSAEFTEWLALWQLEGEEAAARRTAEQLSRDAEVALQARRRRPR